MLIIIIYISKKSNKVNENWRDLPFIGNKNNATYNKINPLNISNKSSYLSYPISTPLDDDYYDYNNKLIDPKLSMLRNLLRKVEIYTNQGNKSIIFNYAEQPVESKQVDKNRIKILSDTIVDLINKFADSILTVKYVKTLNEIHEETDEQSRISFDLKILLYYPDSTKLGNDGIKQYDIIYVQPEFIFEKKRDLLEEDQFFLNKVDKKVDFKVYLSKLILLGTESLGYLSGRYGLKTRYRKIN